MKKTCIIFVFLLIASFNLTAEDLNGIISFDLSIDTIDIKYTRDDNSREEQLDTLMLTTLGVSFFYELTDNLKIGLRTGYSFKKFTKTASFQELPLSISLLNQSFNSMYFSLLADFEVMYHKTISLNVLTHISYYKMFKIQNTINLPVIEGEVVLQNYFIKGSLDFICSYDGIEGFVLYVGPSINFITGRNKAIETIGDIEGEEIHKFIQTRIFGITTGAVLELWDSFALYAKAKLLSHFSINFGVEFEF